jgi:hypothetical protein
MSNQGKVFDRFILSWLGFLGACGAGIGIFETVFFYLACRTFEEWICTTYIMGKSGGI